MQLSIKQSTVQLVNSKLNEMFPASQAATSSEITTILDQEIQTIFRSPDDIEHQHHLNQAYLRVEVGSPMFSRSATLTQAAWNGQTELVSQLIKDQDLHRVASEVFQNMIASGTKSLTTEQYQILLLMANIAMMIDGADSCSSGYTDELILETVRRGDRENCGRLLRIYNNMGDATTNGENLDSDIIRISIKYGHNEIAKEISGHHHMFLRTPQPEPEDQNQRSYTQFMTGRVAAVSIRYQNLEMFKHYVDNVAKYIRDIGQYVQSLTRYIFDNRNKSFFNLGYSYLEAKLGQYLTPRDRMVATVARGLNPAHILLSYMEQDNNVPATLPNTSVANSVESLKLLLDHPTQGPQFRQILMAGHGTRSIEFTLPIVGHLIEAGMLTDMLRNRILKVGDLDVIKEVIERASLVGEDVLSAYHDYLCKGKFRHARFVLEHPAAAEYLKANIADVINLYANFPPVERFDFEFLIFMIQRATQLGVVPVPICYNFGEMGEFNTISLFHNRNVRTNFLYLFDQQAKGNIVLTNDFEARFKIWASNQGYYELATLPDQVRDSVMKSAARL